MSRKNKLSRLVGAVNRLPGPARERALSLLLGRVVPYVGTSRVRIKEMTAERLEAVVPNARKVRNHIGQVHAAAMALAAETVSGLVVGMNVPDDRLPLIKTLHVDYRRRSKGAIRAVATLTQEQREMIQREEKGEVQVRTVATDESGREPIECEMIWAWVPKKRRA